MAALRDHGTWWKAPLTATLVGLPLLVGEFLLFRADGYTSGIEILLALSAILLAISWLLPHSRTWRTPRLIAAATALAITLLPFLFAVLLGLAMTS
ncbi:hypothetical protein ACF09L_16635 [Streptomyces sp. NPDC014779]|uniref:hypothetical protein n=1 Tax=Streptomyces sp. NPDC014779 TaxID=3364911 RepID=UPI0037028C8C